MKFKKKIRRRIQIVSATMGGLAIVGAGAYIVRDRQLDRRAAASYVEGKASLKAGEFESALHAIGRYVQREPEDVAALFEYAEARRQVPMPNNRHLADTMGLLRRVLDKQPDHLEAAHALLELYLQVGFNTEAEDLADRLIAGNPSDLTALRARATVLYRTRRFDKDQALIAARAFRDAAPSDINAELLIAEVLRKMDRPDERLAAWARDLRAAGGESLRTLFLSSVAASYSQDVADARRWASAAVKHDDSNPVTIDLLRRQCDSLGLFPLSTELLVRFNSIAKSADSHRLLSGRLYRLGRHAEVIALTPPEGANRDPESAAIRALSFAKLGQRDKAAEVTAAMATDPSKGASAWHAFAVAMQAQGDGNDAEIIRAAEMVLSIDSADALARFALADAYTHIGETDAAIAAFKQTIADAPAWSEPYVRLAWAARTLGRADESAQLAQAAVDRNPTNQDALLALAIAQASVLKPGQLEQASAIGELLDRADAVASSENFTLPIRVQVAAITDSRAGAIDLAQRGMSTSKVAPSALMQLLSISQTFGLELERTVLERYEADYGVSPELAYFRARRLFAEGKATEGVALIEDAQAASKETSADWAVVRAQYFELIADSRAKQAWKDLADQHPKNVKFQWLAVASKSVQDDRVFIGKILDRLQSQLGGQGLTWRLARAQWLLDGQDSQSTIQAAMILNDITRGQPDLLAPRLLLADCLIRLNQETGAIEQLSAASNLQPQSAAIALRLGELLARRGDQSKARPYLDRVLDNPTATPDQRRLAATLVARTGDVDAALVALERRGKDAATSAADARLDLLRAQLYWRAGKAERVEALCAPLLASPTIESLAFVADYYAATGRAADADSILTQLAATEGSPAEKTLARAQYELRHGSREEALKAFGEAAQLSPQNVAIWRQWIRASAGLSTFDTAVSAAKSAAKQFPDDAGVKAFLEQSDAVLLVRERWPEAVELSVDLLDDVSSTDACKTALELFRSQGPADTETAARLAKLATRFDRSAGIQKAAVRAMLATQNPKEAASIAFRAMRGFPQDAKLAEMSTMAYAAAEQWENVRDSAAEWRKRTPGDTVPADTLMAAADVRLGNVARARARLQPYMDRAIVEPDRYADVVLLVSSIDVIEGKAASAATLLRPSLTKGAKWRVAWMQLAARSIADAAVAKQWLLEVEPLCDASTLAERMALAQSWMLLAERTKDRSAIASARRIGEAMLAGDKVDPTTLTSVAQLREADEDIKGAEALYREALQRDPKQPVAANNLAMILSRDGSELQAAASFAEAAVASAEGDPNRAEYFDTLGSILALKGEPAKAAQAAGQALEIAPRRVDFRIKQIRWLKESGDLGGAKEALTQLDRQPSAVAELPRPLQADLRELRQALAQ